MYHNSRNEPLRRDIEVAAQFAETLVNPEYRHAMTTAFEHAADPEEYLGQRLMADELIVTGIRTHKPGAEKAWELRRQATLTELGGTSLGAFGDYLHQQGGEAAPSAMTLEELGVGKPEIVRTNSQIVGLNKVHEEPIDFMLDSLDVIDSQPATAKGPENYATTLKFFTDKYLDFPSSHLDNTLLKEAIDRCMDGFTDVAEDDRPNFVEMTNLYYAIRGLPNGSFDKKYTEDIIGHSLEQLPTYNSATLSLMIASMSKLDFSATGEPASTLIDLALRMSSKMERSAHMVQAVRAVANLPSSNAAERAFGTFLQLRNNLEQPQNLEGLDSINSALVHIVKNVITNPELSQQAKSLAEQCAGLGVRLIRKKENLGDTTPEEVARLRSTVRRIIFNYNQI
jgi:hypothetical protein